MGTTTEIITKPMVFEVVTTTRVQTFVEVAEVDFEVVEETSTTVVIKTEEATETLAITTTTTTSATTSLKPTMETISNHQLTMAETLVLIIIFKHHHHSKTMAVSSMLTLNQANLVTQDSRNKVTSLLQLTITPLHLNKMDMLSKPNLAVNFNNYCKINTQF